jgi:polysaccharide export outer membrane protein
MLLRQEIVPFRRLCRISVLLVLASGCGRGIQTFHIPQEGTGNRNLAAIHQIANRLPAADYTIGPGDVIKVKVFGAKDLEATVRIPESGGFKFPLVGTVRAAGRTASQIQDAMAKSLRQRYINDPHVLVFIEEYNSYHVSVVGAVNTPGTVVLTKGGCTLVDALAEAGGLTDKAGSELFVTSVDGSGKTTVRTVNLCRLLEQGDLAENPALLPGDSIYAPEGGYVFVTGRVKAPGAYPIYKDMTSLQAISTAGDFLSTASYRVRLIRRTSPETVEIRKIDLADVSAGKAVDVVLRKSDVLEAEASFWKMPVYGTLDFIKGVLGVGTSIN